MLFASKHFCRSAGVVVVMEGGPSNPEEQTQTSRRPKELRTSSIRESVSCSLAMLSGNPMTLVLGYALLTSVARPL